MPRAKGSYTQDRVKQTLWTMRRQAVLDALHDACERGIAMARSNDADYPQTIAIVEGTLLVALRLDDDA